MQLSPALRSTRTKHEKPLNNKLASGRFVRAGNCIQLAFPSMYRAGRGSHAAIVALAIVCCTIASSPDSAALLLFSLPMWLDTATPQVTMFGLTSSKEGSSSGCRRYLGFSTNES